MTYASQSILPCKIHSGGWNSLLDDDDNLYSPYLSMEIVRFTWYVITYLFHDYYGIFEL